MSARWDGAIQHRGAEVDNFIKHYFAKDSRKVLLIAGAGFDPRSSKIIERLHSVLGTGLHAVLVREERPEPDLELRTRAQENHDHLLALAPGARTVHINVFATDGAAVLGRSVVERLRELDLSTFTDVIVDATALSIGASFPTSAYVLAVAVARRGLNVHVMVAANSMIDEMITPVSTDVVSPVHGFKGGWKTAQQSAAARLWMPQLAFGQSQILDRIRREVHPDDIAPVLPFPARHPRLGDELIEHYGEELSESWNVGPRDLIYAEESNPLDLYRTILRLDDRRRPVFAETGGSVIILSPVGSKVMAMGAMLAAIEREMPVLYAEAVGYEADFSHLAEASYVEADLVHVWLHGDVYDLGPLDN
jgi:hypothetical protein